MAASTRHSIPFARDAVFPDQSIYHLEVAELECGDIRWVLVELRLAMATILDV